jgi:hypothetical protein
MSQNILDALLRQIFIGCRTYTFLGIQTKQTYLKSSK